MEKQQTWTIGTILAWTRQYFSDKGVDNPRLDAEVLLSHILQKDRLYLYVHFDQPLEKSELAAFRESIKKRVQRIPVAYILGHKEFMGLDFAVNPAVLIPRPDTEILVEAALARLQAASAPRILDIGTGSGAIAVSVLVKCPQACGIAVDISEQALQVARANAERHNVTARLCCQHSDLFSALAEERFDMIMSNPPYIRAADIAGLAPEVQKEPHLALSGGADGLDFYRKIIADSRAHLKPGGFLIFEAGQGQTQQIAALGIAAGLGLDDIVADYAGIERTVILRCPA